MEKTFSYQSVIHICSGSSYDMCELTVIGQAFLWHQIRCIVAVLFLVGQERESPQVRQQNYYVGQIDYK